MPANYQMPASEQESPPFPDNDTNMPDYDKMTDKKHISGECPFFNTSQELMSDTSFRKYFDEYHDPSFYRILIYEIIIEKKKVKH